MRWVHLLFKGIESGVLVLELDALIALKELNEITLSTQSGNEQGRRANAIAAIRGTNRLLVSLI
ncbi:hypothetical protein [Rudanella lutea]|uniref:hypothetical protein n=1 Tax=Rudanella lutea TaxID=451374 RepID=UPI00036159D5|nr:hypothetical protein [Rudanella lutea]